jgi:hypothetical protein
LYFWANDILMEPADRLRTLIWLTIFSIAMGYFESAVVVYIRTIYYPSGFDFPMVTMPAQMALTEIIREACTMTMLFSIAFLAGKNLIQRFAWFIYCFAIWDIFYYIFLKALIGWPESLFTWDILFLIPMVWTGPVITPVIVSATMILLALMIIFRNIATPASKTYWLILTGAFIIFLSFVWDFGSYMLRHYTVHELLKYERNQEALGSYVPVQFNWWLFVIGEIIILIALGLEFSRSKHLHE